MSAQCARERKQHFPRPPPQPLARSVLNRIQSRTEGVRARLRVGPEQTIESIKLVGRRPG